MIRVDLLDYKNPVFESVVSIDSVDSVVPMEEESFKRFLSYFVEKFSGRRSSASIALRAFLNDSIELS